MTDINQLLDELQGAVARLQDLVGCIDSDSERVAKLFADIRASVPRPMTLVFADRFGVPTCTVGGVEYSMIHVRGKWYGGVDGELIADGEHREVAHKLQSHFNAAWSAMTAKGAAT